MLRWPWWIDILIGVATVAAVVHIAPRDGYAGVLGGFLAGAVISIGLCRASGHGEDA